MVSQCDAEFLIAPHLHSKFIEVRVIGFDRWRGHPFEESDRHGFVALRLTAKGSALPGSAVMDVELPGGAVLRVNDAEVIRDLVDAILEHGARP